MRDPGVPLLVDAAQSVGRAAPLPGGGPSLMASAHKWGGPAGVGVLAVRGGTRWRAPWPVDEREGGRVAGVPRRGPHRGRSRGAGRPGRLAAAEDERLSSLVQRIRSQVDATVPDTQVLGDPADRLPHVVTFSCLYVDGEAVLDELDRSGFAVLSGSSCIPSSVLEPSHVLVAMGALSREHPCLVAAATTDADVDRLLAVLPGCVRAPVAKPPARPGCERRRHEGRRHERARR